MASFLYSGFLKFAIILPFYFFFLFSEAQSLIPDITISNGSTGYDDYSKFTLDNEGNLYCIAKYSYNAYINNVPFITYGSNNIILSKFDKNGNFIWGKTLAYGSSILLCEIAINENNIYISGSFMANLIFINNDNSQSDTLKSRGSYDLFLAKFQSDGTLMNKISYGSSNDDKIVGLKFLDNNIIISGTFNNFIEFDRINSNEQNTIYSVGNVDIFLTCLDLNFNYIWSKRAGGHYDDELKGMAIFNEEIYLTGSFVNTMNFNTPSSGNGNVLSSYGYGDIFVAKYDKYGNTHWIKRAGSSNDDNYGGSSEESGGDIYVNKHGVYVVGNGVSKTHFNGPLDTNYLIYNSSNYSIRRFFAHYSHNGNIKWVKELKSVGMGYFPLIHGTDHYIGISEIFNSQYAIYSSYYQDTININAILGEDIITRLYDFEGNFITGASLGSVNYERVTDLFVSKNKIYLTGSFQETCYFFDDQTVVSQIVTRGYSDIFIVQYPFPDFIIDTIEIPNNNITLFPNPADKQITITNTTDQIGLKYLMFDMMGKLVFQGELTQNENIINISELNAGVYFVKIMTTKPKTIKFVKY